MICLLPNMNMFCKILRTSMHHLSHAQSNVDQMHYGIMKKLRQKKRELRRLERRWLSTKFEIHKQSFKDLSRQYNEMIKQAKLDYHKMQFENCNSKQLFQKVDKLSKLKSAKILPSEVDGVSLADRFSTFFADKIRCIKDNL